MPPSGSPRWIKLPLPPPIPPAAPAQREGPGLASLLNDIASEMIFPLLPTFLITALGGNRFTWA
jgi:hypothetical protein